MKRRIEVGTDVALLGAWDESCEIADFASLSMKQIDILLNDDAKSGQLFLMELGADWGGGADIYVNVEIDPEGRDRLRPVGDEYLVSLPSGQMVVGGVEDYRSAEKRITSDASVVKVPPGEYGIRCFINVDEDDVPDAPEPNEVEAAMGSELYAHYQKWNSRTRKGFWLLLLFIPIAYWFGWIAGAVVTIAIFIAFFHLAEWMQKQDARYVEADAIYESLLRSHDTSSPPVLALLLRGPLESHQLTGGRVDISSA